jgi:hypothetical protein
MSREFIELRRVFGGDGQPSLWGAVLLGRLAQSCKREG